MIINFSLVTYSHVKEPNNHFFQVFTRDPENELKNFLAERNSENWIIKRVLYVPQGTAVIQLDFLEDYHRTILAYGSGGETARKSVSFIYVCLKNQVEEPFIDLYDLMGDMICEVPLSLHYCDELGISNIGGYNLIPYSFDDKWYPPYRVDNRYYCLGNFPDIDEELEKFIDSLKGLSNDEIRGELNKREKHYTYGMLPKTQKSE